MVNDVVVRSLAGAGTTPGYRKPSSCEGDLRFARTTNHIEDKTVERANPAMTAVSEN